ncbi:MAG: methyl-accepting chemotaxis protein [Candidatus Thiodiazotropha sp. (ex Dulcina madagascariensis)]|nr:methyl-accepting chemotaxis protein [Candidatus Thiodiazotropha sp. (ex Dulcina madagascariensis)]
MSVLTNLPIKWRLTILVGISILVSIIIGLLGLTGMRSAEQAIDEMFNGGMQHTHALGVILEHNAASRTQILLSLQHDPASEFSGMHDHPLSHHLNAINENLEIVDEHWNEVTAIEMEGEEKTLADTFAASKSRLEDEGIQPAIAQLKAGNYTQTNKILLETINPLLVKTQETIDELFEMQMVEAEGAYKETEASYHSMINLVTATLVAGALFSAALAYFTISSIAKGVQRIERTANELADGDLTSRVDYQNKDELGHIASAFNRMADKFRGMVDNVKDSVTQLASAAEETSVVTAQTTAGINQQHTETDQIATAINQMNATVHDVAQNAVHAAEATRNADASSEEGKKVVDKTIEAINQLATEVEQAAKVIHELEQETENIGSVLDVIKSIAEQTNLLALNAAIEAARAGEQGRGFAVVADEVRTLAGRTQQSTQEIEEMISRLQTGANKAVQVMETGKTKTLVGVEQAAAAGKALETINAAVESINNMNTQIASAAEEQSSVTEEINRNITNISQVAEQTSSGAAQTAQASDDLARLAEQLKGLVAQFKV